MWWGDGRLPSLSRAVVCYHLRDMDLLSQQWQSPLDVSHRQSVRLQFLTSQTFFILYRIIYSYKYQLRHRNEYTEKTHPRLQKNDILHIVLRFQVDCTCLHGGGANKERTIFCYSF